MFGISVNRIAHQSSGEKSKHCQGRIIQDQMIDYKLNHSTQLSLSGFQTSFTESYPIEPMKTHLIFNLIGSSEVEIWTNNDFLCKLKQNVEHVEYPLSKVQSEKQKHILKILTLILANLQRNCC